VHFVPLHVKQISLRPINDESTKNEKPEENFANRDFHHFSIKQAVAFSVKSFRKTVPARWALRRIVEHTTVFTFNLIEFNGK
jgi:hypothetical protein